MLLFCCSGWREIGRSRSWAGCSGVKGSRGAAKLRRARPARRRRAQLPPARLGGPRRGPPCDAQPRSSEAQQATARPAFAICLVDLSVFRFSFSRSSPAGVFFVMVVQAGSSPRAALCRTRPSQRSSRSPGQPGAVRRSTTGTVGVSVGSLRGGGRHIRKSSSSPSC
eukprot:COSAG04_NODE_495_length_13411_cov_35.496094_6_plen_167_part_00